MANRCMRPGPKNGRASLPAFRSPWPDRSARSAKPWGARPNLRAFQIPLHQQSWAEAGFEAAHDGESAGQIELLGVHVADDMQRLRTHRARRLSAVFDQLSPDAATLKAGLDKQRVEFGVAISARHNGGKADDGAILFEDEHAARRNLFRRQVDGIRMAQQGIAIAFIAERCAPLQRLEGAALSGNGGSDNHAAELYAVAGAVISTGRPGARPLTNGRAGQYHYAGSPWPGRTHSVGSTST